ncbi:MAG TPA: trehalase family glycosidase [Anaerolineales bacterium]|nr:trehalase family glycosidase [Anaerolineales bacterium]
MDYLQLLENQIDITRLPFSDRGSRLLLSQNRDKCELYVRLVERLTSVDPAPESYLARPPFVDRITLIDANSTPLDFSVTSAPHQLQFHTRLGDFAVVFQDVKTLSWRLPDHTPAGLRFHVAPQYWRQSADGGVFRSIRNLSYRTNGDVIRNRITPLETGYEVELIALAPHDSTVTLSVYPEHGESGPIQPFSMSLLHAEGRWSEWFDRVPKVADRYASTYALAWWVMANNIVSPQGNVLYESMSPSKVNYVGLWLWDNAFHSLAYRHVDATLARDQILGMLAHQLPNGMLPDAVYDEGIVSSIDHPIVGQVTKPPLLAWAALKLHTADPDIEFLQRIYMPLVLSNAWWLHMNDDDGDGLAQYNHPYSSGLDDSPLWDSGMPVESPDLNTYLCVQMKSLAALAEHLGMDAEARMWRKRASAIARRMIEDLWDDQTGIFWARGEAGPVKVLTPFGLYPLWTGEMPERIRARLIEHLINPEEFWGRYLIPTVARNDPRYSPSTMWRGPVWANINYFFVEALDQLGEVDLADRLREATLALIMEHPNLGEYYDSENGEIPQSAALAFGWTASVFIDLAIQATRRAQDQER